MASASQYRELRHFANHPEIFENIILYLASCELSVKQLHEDEKCGAACLTKLWRYALVCKIWAENIIPWLWRYVAVGPVRKSSVYAPQHPRAHLPQSDTCMFDYASMVRYLACYFDESGDYLSALRAADRRCPRVKELQLHIQHGDPDVPLRLLAEFLFTAGTVCSRPAVKSITVTTSYGTSFPNAELVDAFIRSFYCKIAALYLYHSLLPLPNNAIASLDKTDDSHGPAKCTYPNLRELVIWRDSNLMAPCQALRLSPQLLLLNLTIQTRQDRLDFVWVLASHWPCLRNLELRVDDNSDIPWIGPINARLPDKLACKQLEHFAFSCDGGESRTRTIMVDDFWEGIVLAVTSSAPNLKYLDTCIRNEAMFAQIMRKLPRLSTLMIDFHASVRWGKSCIQTVAQHCSNIKRIRFEPATELFGLGAHLLEELARRCPNLIEFKTLLLTNHSSDEPWWSVDPTVVTKLKYYVILGKFVTQLFDDWQDDLYGVATELTDVDDCEKLRMIYESDMLDDTCWPDTLTPIPLDEACAMVSSEEFQQLKSIWQEVDCEDEFYFLTINVEKLRNIAIEC